MIYEDSNVNDLEDSFCFVTFGDAFFIIYNIFGILVDMI